MRDMLAKDRFSRVRASADRCGVVDLIALRLLEISQLEERPDFDFTRSRHRIGAALHPRDGLIHIFDFPEPEAGYEFAGLGERPIADRALRAVEGDALTLRGWFKAVSSDEDAGCAEFVIEPAPLPPSSPSSQPSGKSHLRYPRWPSPAPSHALSVSRFGSVTGFGTTKPKLGFSRNCSRIEARARTGHSHSIVPGGLEVTS